MSERIISALDTYSTAPDDLKLVGDSNQDSKSYSIGLTKLRALVGVNFSSLGTDNIIVWDSINNKFVDSGVDYNTIAANTNNISTNADNINTNANAIQTLDDNKQDLFPNDEMTSVADTTTVQITNNRRAPMSVIKTYIKSAFDSIYVPLARTINSKALTADVEIYGTDIELADDNSNTVYSTLYNHSNSITSLGNAVNNNSNNIADLHSDKVDKTTTVQGKPLSSNVTLTASDLNAYDSDYIDSIAKYKLQNYDTSSNTNKWLKLFTITLDQTVGAYYNADFTLGYVQLTDINLEEYPNPIHFKVLANRGTSSTTINKKTINVIEGDPSRFYIAEDDDDTISVYFYSKKSFARFNYRYVEDRGTQGTLTIPTNFTTTDSSYTSNAIDTENTTQADYKLMSVNKYAFHLDEDPENPNDLQNVYQITLPVAYDSDIPVYRVKIVNKNDANSVYYGEWLIYYNNFSGNYVITKLINDPNQLININHYSGTSFFVVNESLAIGTDVEVRVEQQV